MAISFQNRRVAQAFDDAAEGQVVVGDHAAGVGQPGFVPLVWSLGRQINTRCGELAAGLEIGSSRRIVGPVLVGHVQAQPT